MSTSATASVAQVRDLAGLLSAVITDIWCRILLCISMSVAVEFPICAELDSKMINLSLVTRAAAAQSPILGRSKSPRRCQLEPGSAGRSSCRSPARSVNAAPAVEHHMCNKCLQVNANSEKHFPHFQPATRREFTPPSNKAASLGSCCGSSSKQSASHKTRTMFPCDLANKLKVCDQVLLIDCRSFIAFNLNHIVGALNVSCSDRLTKKRLQCNKVQVGDLVSPGQEAKDEYSEKRSCESTDIVLYDDNTEDLDKLPANSPLHLVLGSLVREGASVHFLKGGLSSFQSRYSNLCAKPSNKPANTPLFSPTTPIIHSEIDTATVSEILPFLFIGNERDAASQECLKNHGISHVLNVTSHLPLHFEGEKDFQYCRLPASDSAHQNLTQYFDGAFDFIERARKSNGKVMIHCQAGVSRSSTLVIAYLMKHSELSMSSAFRFVKSKRSIIAPNFNFMGQLMEFERQLNQGQIARDLALKLNIEEAV